jgi:hypothetical protein
LIFGERKKLDEIDGKMERYFASFEWHIIDEFNKNYLTVVLVKLSRQREERELDMFVNINGFEGMFEIWLPFLMDQVPSSMIHPCSIVTNPFTPKTGVNKSIFTSINTKKNFNNKKTFPIFTTNCVHKYENLFR